MFGWLTLNSETGEITGTPSNEDVATFDNISITVTDANGLSDTIDGLSIEVLNINDVPEFSSTPILSVNEDSHIYILFKALM